MQNIILNILYISIPPSVKTIYSHYWDESIYVIDINKHA